MCCDRTVRCERAYVYSICSITRFNFNLHSKKIGSGVGRLGEERRLGQRRKYIREMKHFKTNRGENTWTSNTLDVLRTCGVNVTSILDEKASKKVEELPKIGVYGLPSAGKSTLMNAMAGRKVTSTSATPGHTKHIQTWYVVRSQNTFFIAGKLRGEKTQVRAKIRQIPSCCDVV